MGVVIKAQVLVGGRGKAGGVKLAGFDDAEQVAATILGMDIKGMTVAQGPGRTGRRAIVKEFYLAAVLDRRNAASC